nr:MAG TPA: hypothetical protein [Caudoviricetes sp.]
MWDIILLERSYSYEYGWLSSVRIRHPFFFRKKNI